MGFWNEGARARINTMNGQNAGLKRREPDDDLLQDLLNVSLSPPKKSRVSGAGETTSSAQGSVFAPANAPEMQWDSFPGIPSAPKPEPLAAVVPPLSAAEEQKALVLYRPVTPPLFPGGPPVGSVDFPYKVNSSMLPIPQGTDSELTLHQLDFQSACSNDTDTPSGHGIFQALDLSGGPMPLFPGQRRLSRVSSCSSLPRFSSDMEDQVMVEEIDKSSERAVIPWVPMTPIVVHSEVRPIIEEADDEPDVDEMMEGDSMEVVNEDNVLITETSTTPMAGQFGSPLPSFNAAPWQAEILQHPYTTPMRSH